MYFYCICRGPEGHIVGDYWRSGYLSMCCIRCHSCLYEETKPSKHQDHQNSRRQKQQLQVKRGV